MPYRVVLWTTGHVARFAGRAVLAHPDLELVGAYAWSPDKVGCDVGELVGAEPIGIAATNDVDELLAASPDVVGYYQLLRPDAIAQHTEMLCRFLEAGVNVVSTSNLVTGRWWGAEARLDAAGRAGNASLFASGVNPGFVNQLVLTATGVCSEVRHVSVWEEAECSGYDSPELWETVAFGHDPGEPGIDAAFRAGTAVFEDAVAMTADALRVELDEVRYVPEVAVATRDLDLGFMRIAEGHVAGLRNRWLGVAGGREVIELGTLWKMTEDVEPNWPVRHGWHLRIDGTPTVKLHVAGWPPEGETNSEVLMGLAMLMTAMPTVHAIPHVVAARPGVVTYKDLPLVTAAGCVRAG
ncbi:MAG TPA: dihydrodipicolinate reductase [Acidimicrobiia bacterium]|nr:dihydrodipicolinate reductase [Acidimicrobiia bacterium]